MVYLELLNATFVCDVGLSGMSAEKLGKFLREVSNWSWEEFVKAEHDKTYTSNQAMIFALIRSCAMQKMQAITMSLNRLDGKLKTPIKIEFPKIYYLFPKATLETPTPQPELTAPEVTTGEVLAPLQEEAPEAEANDLPSLSLRETLSKMSDYPRDVPEMIVAWAQQTEQWLRSQNEQPDEIPAVKSVVAAHLLILAQKRDLGALSEVFDQIDGKLAETLQILGEDIYITSYGSTAPEGAELNKDGVLQIEATQAQNLWAQKLGGQAS